MSRKPPFKIGDRVMFTEPVLPQIIEDQLEAGEHTGTITRKGYYDIGIGVVWVVTTTKGKEWHVAELWEDRNLRKVPK